MTNEQFLALVNNELENQRREFQKLMKRYEYLRFIRSNEDETKELEYKLKLLCYKINDLRVLSTLPLYSRIQSMSDIETEVYKRKIIDDIDLKIGRLESKEKEEQEKLLQLKTLERELIANLSNHSKEERRKIISKINQLDIEINRYESYNEWGIFTSIKREIKDLKVEQKKTSLMTPQEIKMQLLSKMEEDYRFNQVFNDARKPIDDLSKLIFSVADDPKKAKVLSLLLQEYSKISNFKVKELFFDNKLPHALYSKLANSELCNLDELLEIIEEFDSTFEKAKASYDKQFTVEKLKPLLNRNINQNYIDDDFLYLHADKMDDNDFANLQSLIIQREKLNKKIFKTNKVRTRINKLNKQINQASSKIYGTIINWYLSQDMEILGTTPISFSSVNSLLDSLNKCQKDINISQKAILELKKRILFLKKEFDLKVHDNESKKAIITQKIRTLAGEEYKDFELPPVLEESKSSLDQIISSANHVYQKGIVDKVLLEAQSRASASEAYLRGITIEELQKVKQSQSFTSDTSNSEEQLIIKK